MEASRISVKATTSEKMNDEGAEKCITARTVCTITYRGLTEVAFYGRIG